MFYIREQIVEKYGEEFFEQGGMKIHTTIDPKLQQEAERIVREQVAQNIEKFDASNAALISIDNSSHEIRAMV